MNQILSYIAKASPIHALDARVKLGLLLLFSIALFCMRTWIGLGIFAAILLGVMIASRIPLKNYGRVLLPALAILIFIWVCNSIPFDALRFIPLLFEQLGQIKIAQTSRGAQFGSGSLWKRLKTWMVVLIPLFIGFFRQADSVAEAMDARCYGAGERTSLNAQAMRVGAWVLLSVALVACVLCVLFL